MPATTVMICNVNRLDEELKIVKFEAGSMLEGIRLGNNPVTPVKTTKTIVRQEKRKAMWHDPFVI